MKSRLVVCSGAAVPPHLAADHTYKVISLSTRDRQPNVNLRLEDVARTFTEDLSPRLLDFLEIAAYVHAADASTTRDAKWDDDGATEPWDRRLHFVIPVRDVAFWQTEAVQQALRDVSPAWPGRRRCSGCRR